MAKASDRFQAMAKKFVWKEFVCRYIAAKTARKPYEGYQVKVTDAGVVLTYGGVPSFAPMSYETAYSWFERTPLVRLSREADDVRYETLAA